MTNFYSFYFVECKKLNLVVAVVVVERSACELKCVNWSVWTEMKKMREMSFICRSLQVSSRSENKITVDLVMPPFGGGGSGNSSFGVSMSRMSWHTTLATRSKQRYPLQRFCHSICISNILHYYTHKKTITMSYAPYFSRRRKWFLGTRGMLRLGWKWVEAMIHREKFQDHYDSICIGYDYHIHIISVTYLN